MRLAVAILAAACMLAGHAVAQSFPERPITLINPYAAGGPADLLARTVADGMSEVLGRPVVVENRPGRARRSAREPSPMPSRTATCCLSEARLRT